jgi:hypothetical protein
MDASFHLATSASWLFWRLGCSTTSTDLAFGSNTISALQHTKLAVQLREGDARA